MNSKVKTRYKILGSDLLKDDAPTGIRIEDDYFYRGLELLNIYVEDGKIFSLSSFLPFLGFFKISRATDLTIDSEGNIWGKKKSNILDELTS